jgi:ABC-type dipeptide/oligopeptide/nickel transport system permease subunit
MVARTRDSRLAPARGRAGVRNSRATASVILGLLAVLAIPAGVVLSWYSATVTLVESSSSAGLAIIFGVASIVFSRRGRDVFARTIGRSGGDRAARAGKLLGALGLCMGITAGLAVGFYGLLIVFVKS